MNKTNTDNSTPLDKGAMNGWHETARLLIGHGANIDVTDMWGRTPLHRACYNGHTQVVRLLLEAGADGTKKDREGSTPLDDASYLPRDLPARELIIDLFREFRPELVLEMYCNRGPQR